MEDYLTSRFFRTDDFNDLKFVFDMPSEWWSRKYEYHWAGKFCDSNAVVLDAACGIEHPLKFYLSDHCARCHACDLDHRLTNPEEVRSVVIDGFKVTNPAQFPDRYLNEVDYRLASLTQLPYDDGMFDRIFCVSVLEHLRDRLNRWPWLGNVGALKHLFRRDIRDSLAEFKRTLKPGGLIVLTFDYPRINLDYLQMLVDELDLQFAGPTEFTLPSNAIFYPKKRLNCFRAVLTTNTVTERSLRKVA